MEQCLKIWKNNYFTCIIIPRQIITLVRKIVLMTLVQKHYDVKRKKPGKKGIISRKQKI